jgi:hypothetical protein
MLLEIENALYKRIHEAVGQSAVVHRLAEDIDSSGAVIENTNIVVSFSSASTNNPNKGAYIPTVRNRQIYFKVTILQKQSQRVGHSFALPLLDIIADYITGWVPCIKGLKFQTGFELQGERFTQITEASQYIYEQNYSIEVLIPDGRMVSSICAATEPLNLCDYIPSKRCLVTNAGDSTSLAVWRIKTGEDTYEEYIVVDEKNCPPNGELSWVCDLETQGKATFRFIPFSAYYNDPRTGELKFDEEKVVTGELMHFIPCLKNPPPTKFKVYTNLWLNSINKVGERKDPKYYSIVPTNLDIFNNE